MEIPDLPVSVVIWMTDGEILRGVLVENRPDGWLLDEESGRLIHVYSQDVDQIDPRDEDESEEHGSE